MDRKMLGIQERWQEDLFVAGPLSSLIPDDHILKKVDKVLDLSWLRKEVSELYCQTNGRPGIDPESAVRLMLAGFFQGIVHDRKLMREAQVNIAIRWFAGYRLDEKLPDHSSLTKIRQRWGVERFKQIFVKIVNTCVEANLVSGETVHVDATLIRADVSWESLSTRHIETVIKENATDDVKTNSTHKSAIKTERFSTTDPDATLTKSCKIPRMEPSYKQHAAIDDDFGIIVDVNVTTGKASEGAQLPKQVERIESNIGKKIKTLSADRGYAYSKNYDLLETKDIEAIIPPLEVSNTSKCLPARLFKYDSKNDIVKCPAGKILTKRNETPKGWTYRSNMKDCLKCPLHKNCVNSKRQRSIVIVHGYQSLLRARRRHCQPDKKYKEIYHRHRWMVEGMHGEAKTQHGLRRAVRRGLDNVAIQSYLTASVINLKRLVTHTGLFIDKISLCFWINLPMKYSETEIKPFIMKLSRKSILRKAA
jgi:transposase